MFNPNNASTNKTNKWQVNRKWIEMCKETRNVWHAGVHTALFPVLDLHFRLNLVCLATLGLKGHAIDAYVQQWKWILHFLWFNEWYMYKRLYFMGWMSAQHQPITCAAQQKGHGLTAFEPIFALISFILKFKWIRHTHKWGLFLVECVRYALRWRSEVGMMLA